MSRYYNKEELKSRLTIHNIFDLLETWGGEPEYSGKGLVSQTICHNKPGEGSRKLYYYDNGGIGIFQCYTNCGSFDVFDLCIKVMKIQYGYSWELYDAMDYIAGYFGFEGKEIEDENQQELEDWEVFKRHDINIKSDNKAIQLKEYNPVILTRFSYPRIIHWEKEGILPEVCQKNLIGYYAGGEQITIPHRDLEGRLIGIRGRYLAQEDAERYGKYRPLLVNKTLYNHPLSMNLYHLDQTKENIRRTKTAVIFESEKATLQYSSYYGEENDISVACCGQNLSDYQIRLLCNLGVNEIIICFDKDFNFIGDEIFNNSKNKMIYISKKYGNQIKVSIVFDKYNILPVHSSPIDQGTKIFESLLNERFSLK